MNSVSTRPTIKRGLSRADVAVLLRWWRDLWSAAVMLGCRLAVRPLGCVQLLTLPPLGSVG